MRALFVTVLAPILYLFSMRVQAFKPKPAVERFDKCVVGRLAWLAEVERDAMLVGPEIQIARYKLGPLIDADCRRQSNLSGDLLQDVDDVGTAEREPRLQCRGET